MKSPQEDIVYDVAVVGGGPAGMMAAGRAAELGARVILIEKNKSLGVKLLITGGGRSNITNHELELRAFLSKYKENDKFLFSAFSQFAVAEALDFFHARTMDTKTEAEKRVFPKSNKAQSVWDVLVTYMKKGGVEILSDSPVKDFETEDGMITAVVLKSNKKIQAKKFILATGGTSRPETGSTGDGFTWATKMGHSVVVPSVALVPIALKDSWIKKLSGVTLQDIKLITFQNKVKQEALKGKLLFTHFGISGPTILNMSRDIAELLKYGEVEIRLDLVPSLDHGMLNKKLQDLFTLDDKKKIKNSLDTLISSSLIDHVLELSKINPDTKNNSITRQERLRLIDTLKGIPMHVDKLLGSDKAVVSSGGVDLTEVDFKTMQSRIVSNLYLVGDVLNIDRPSGGYSLQLCWTTGWVAGNAVSS